MRSSLLESDAPDGSRLPSANAGGRARGPWRAPGAHRRRGLRRLPHGPPSSRWRAASHPLSRNPRPRDRGDRHRGRPVGRPLSPGRPGRGPLAGAGLWPLPLLSCRPGEPLRVRALPGYSVDGGYAEEVIADARFCFPLPAEPPAARLAPLLCAGFIGYRAYRAAGDGTNLGLYGFGAAAHLLAQVARAQGRRVFAFTRPGDRESQAFARE